MHLRRFKPLNSLIRRLALTIALLYTSEIQSQTHSRPQAMEQANLGVNLAKNARYKEAIAAYQRAIAIDPNLPGIYLNLGLAWFKSGDFKRAAAAFEKEDRRAPGDRTKTLLAMSLFGMGQYRQAAALLQPLAAAERNNTELAYLLAKCYVWSGQSKEAVALFQQLLERDPESPAVHMLMGEALDAERRTVEAISEFEAAAQHSPSQPDVHFGLGYLYWEQRRYDDAEREFSQELRNNPQNPQALAYLGDVMLKKGSNDEALTLLEKSVSDRNDLHIAHVDLAILYEGKKQYEKAAAALRAAIKGDPQAFDSHYRLARLYKLMGKSSEARSELAIVQRLHEEKDQKPLIQVSRPQ